MFSKSKNSQHSLSLPNLRRLSGAFLLGAIGLFLLAGCGGGGGNGNTGGSGTTGSGTGTSGTGTAGTGTSGTGTGPTGSALPAGSYRGVYLNTSGPYSPDAGTLTLTVSSSGTVTGTNFDLTGDGSTNTVTGTVSSSGALVVTGGPSGTLSQNPTTHVFSTSYTEPNGTKGALSIGSSPTASPLAGSYSGTFSSTGGGQGTVTLTISSVGAVAGTAIQQGNSGAISGYVDTAGIVYIASISGNVPQNSIGALTLNGTSLTGVLANAGTDGSNYKVTVSLTKQ